MTSGFEVERVGAGVEVGEFIQEVKGGFRVEFGVCAWSVSEVRDSHIEEQIKARRKRESMKEVGGEK